ncbi:hypothetical protein GX48_04323 [Paracoccidioides brasiliensis]|nr:hypothetical protein GX48_04323 [Paracoccidioides brasiliensis]
MDFTDVDPSEITFKRKLFSSEFSEIFLVHIRNKHHDNGPLQPAPPERETNIHICESTAYRRLNEARPLRPRNRASVLWDNGTDGLITLSTSPEDVS